MSPEPTIPDVERLSEAERARLATTTTDPVVQSRILHAFESCRDALARNRHAAPGVIATICRDAVSAQGRHVETGAPIAPLTTRILDTLRAHWPAELARAQRAWAGKVGELDPFSRMELI